LVQKKCAPGAEGSVDFHLIATVHACWIVLQVVYFDMMQLGMGHVHRVGVTREAMYEDTMVRQLIAADKVIVNEGRFKDYGKGKVRLLRFTVYVIQISWHRKEIVPALSWA
jgi:hypothetical protein